jgi:hypothetical protein
MGKIMGNDCQYNIIYNPNFDIKYLERHIDDLINSVAYKKLNPSVQQFFDRDRLRLDTMVNFESIEQIKKEQTNRGKPTSSQDQEFEIIKNFLHEEKIEKLIANGKISDSETDYHSLAFQSLSLIKKMIKN